MIILGIETSCDETAAAIVENGTIVHSNIIASQIPLHRLTGGVVPEVAAREHVLKIIPVIQEALTQAGKNLGRKNFTLHDLDAIAVTQGPGLLSSLIIGMSAASTLALATGKPLIPVNHIAGHIYANWLGESAKNPIQFPFVVLTVSGGHNELVFMRDHVHFKLLGETLDDAAGEAFDKVARLLGLPYPGGPQISRVAQVGNAKRFKFPKSYLGPDSFDFSFSGLKTAVLNLVKAEHAREGVLSEEFIADCAASFQEAVCEILSDKLLRAAQQYKVKEVHLAGGVSANRRLRELVAQKIAEGYFFDLKGKKVELGYKLDDAKGRTHGIQDLPPNRPPRGVSTNNSTKFFKPKLRYAENISYCTDNAAMIAATAYFHYKKAPKLYLKATATLADPNLNLYSAMEFASSRLR